MRSSLGSTVLLVKASNIRNDACTKTRGRNYPREDAGDLWGCWGLV